MNLFRRRLRDAQSGFALPTVIILTLVLSLVAYAVLVQANNNLTITYKQTYIQIARTASKAAIEYAQEQFDSSTCGTYDGTPEQELISTDRYRVTMKADVVETSADGYEKVVEGTGSVYLPKTSETAKYVFDIKSEVVRTYALCKSPDNFGPLIWLDASDTETLKKTTTSTTTTSSQTGGYILDLFNPNDSVEEKVGDGTQGLFSWLSNDIEMHTCDVAEFTIFACNGPRSNRDLYNGLVFEDINIPQGSVITSATLQFRGATPSGSGGSMTSRVYGLYETTTNPHLELFTPFATNQVKSRIENSSLRTTSYDEHTSNNFPPGNVVNFDVASVMQEIVNNPNWDPTNNNGRLGFGLERVAGNGERRTCKGNAGLGFCANRGPELTVTYAASSAVSQAENTEGVNEWQDKSGNGNHARSTYGNLPTRQDNQINGNTVVRFNNGVMLSALTEALQNEREFTVLAVLKPDFAASTSEGRVITVMSSDESGDTISTKSLLPLMRNVSNSGFSSIYAGTSTSTETDFDCGVVCNNLPYVVSSVFRIESDTAITAQIKGNGQPGSETTGISPSSASPPYTFSADQVYVGGHRTGSMPGNGAKYFNGDYAEIAVYDKALTCREIEALEEYFRDKWNLYASPAETTCPANEIPTL